jgi:hypothetical protein
MELKMTLLQYCARQCVAHPSGITSTTGSIVTFTALNIECFDGEKPSRPSGRHWTTK